MDQGFPPAPPRRQAARPSSPEPARGSQPAEASAALTPRPPPDRFGPLFGAVMGALLGTGLTLAILAAMGVLGEAPGEPATPAATSLLEVAPAGTVPTVAAVASAALPSIVAVEVTGDIANGSGSGVVYSDLGYVITNHHVIAGAEDINVVFSDALGYAGELVGTDPLTDLAVVRVERTDLSPVAIGDPDDLRIGDGAVAVGNPLGLRGAPSVTAGVISAFGRTLEVDGGDILYGLIQTDAPITRGSSGGALLDSTGRLIGITTAIAVRDVGAEGLGFAIPVDLVVSVSEDLIIDGVIEHAFLGIEGFTATEVTARGARVPIGTAISELLPGSAAKAAGAEIGDVIIAIEGEPVTTLDQLITRLRLRRADESVTMSIQRSEAALELEVVLGRYPEQ